MKRETLDRANDLTDQIQKTSGQIEAFQAEIAAIRNKNGGIPWIKQSTEHHGYVCVQLDAERYIMLLSMEIAIRTEQLKDLVTAFDELSE